MVPHQNLKYFVTFSLIILLICADLGDCKKKKHKHKKSSDSCYTVKNEECPDNNSEIYKEQWEDDENVQRMCCPPGADDGNH